MASRFPISFAKRTSAAESRPRVLIRRAAGRWSGVLPRPSAKKAAALARIAPNALKVVAKSAAVVSSPASRVSNSLCPRRSECCARRGRHPTADQWVSGSGADPLNLVGILTSGPRLPALAGNRLLYRGGIPTAGLIADDIQFLEALDNAKEWIAQKELLRGQAPPLPPATRFPGVTDAVGHHAGRRKIERPARIA